MGFLGELELSMRLWYPVREDGHPIVYTDTREGAP